PLGYFARRDEWPAVRFRLRMLWRTTRRAAAHLRPLAASVVVHAVGLYLVVTGVGTAFDRPAVGGAGGDSPAATAATVEWARRPDDGGGDPSTDPLPERRAV